MIIYLQVQYFQNESKNNHLTQKGTVWFAQVYSRVELCINVRKHTPATWKAFMFTLCLIYHSAKKKAKNKCVKVGTVTCSFLSIYKVLNLQRIFLKDESFPPFFVAALLSNSQDSRNPSWKTRNYFLLDLDGRKNKFYLYKIIFYFFFSLFE